MGVPIAKEGSADAGPSGIALPTTAFSRAAEGLIIWIGEAASWLWTLLMLIIVGQVVARYVFGVGSILIEEVQWHIYAVGFLLGFSLAKVRERHVRIDVLAEHFRLTTRVWIELAGLLLFLLPFCAFILWFAWPFVVRSYQFHEVSAAPDGLPLRWVLKSFIVTAFGLLMLAGVARLTRVLAYLGGRRA